MNTILQTLFFQRLSIVLLNSIWQMGLLWLFVVACIKFFNLSAAQKFNLAFAAQVAGFCWCLLNFITFTTRSNTFFSAFPVQHYVTNANTIIRFCLPYIAFLYIPVVVVKLSGLLFIHKKAFRSVSTTFTKMPVDQRLFVKQMSSLLSIKKKVSIFLSSQINCPLTVGYFKPVILVPLAAISHLTTQQIEAIILHELAHIKRADYLLYIIQSVISKLFFFNIFSIMLNDIMERERENACDDLVLQFQYNSLNYAQALLKLGRLQSNLAFAMPSSGKNSNFLLQRIKRILQREETKNNFSIQKTLIAFVAVFISACLLILSPQKQSSNKSVRSITAQHFKTSQKFLPPVQDKNTVAPKADSEKKETASFQSKKSIENNKTDVTVNNDESIAESKLDTAMALNNYILQVKQLQDSVNQALLTYNNAVNTQINITPETYLKAVSYANFKQLENMLSASGDSVSVKQTDASKNSYIKHITIESFDKNGNKHVYNIELQLYQ